MANAYNCIDVSEHNKDIDWNAARQDDVEYAFIRCGFGKDFESQDDKYFHINMEAALEAGVKVGVYFYSYAQSEEAAASEAAHCLRLIEPYRKKLSLPVFYDVEEESIASHIEDTIPVFTRILNDAGYNVGVYCTTWWFDNYFKDIDCDYFWLASWGNDDGEPHTKPEWCDVWQYTSRGRVNGISGYTDCNILYNDVMTALIDQEDEDIPKTVTVEMDVLKIGDTGNQVETLQILLNAFGYRDSEGNELKVDSIFGPKTNSAARAFQAAHGIEADGEVGFLTWSALFK
jgi:GH25 family lysozyme M1 (1,4-beta-N-acetylmuramidase)